MSQGYAPSLVVEERTKIAKVRELPLIGQEKVKLGQLVKAEEIVLTAELPGDLEIIKVAEALGNTPESALKALLVKEGQVVSKGDLLAQARYLFGYLSDEVKSPCSGTIEYILSSTAHIGIRQGSKNLSVKSYISGTVTAIDPGKRVTIETEGALVQGIFGVGGERIGEIFVLDFPADKKITASDLNTLNLQGKIVIGGSTFETEAIDHLRKIGAVGIITGSITSEMLEKLLGRTLGVSMTGDEDLSYSLIITEGFGSLALSPRALMVLKSLHGKQASINGATQVRAGAMRPELIVSNHNPTKSHSVVSAVIEVNRNVRCIRAPYFGQFGVIVDLPIALEQIDSGALVRIAKIKLAAGHVVQVPRANIEIIN